METEKTIIPLTSQVTPQATPQGDEEVKGLLEFCLIPKTRSEIQEFMKLSDRENFRKNILNPLIKGGLLKLTMPDKPTSPNKNIILKKDNTSNLNLKNFSRRAMTSSHRLMLSSAF